MDQSIWAPRGPEKETIGAVTQPLPTAYLIFRAPSQAAGKCWMDALELSLRCSAMLLRSNSGSGGPNTTSDLTIDLALGDVMTHETEWSEADYEKHFKEHGKLFLWILTFIENPFEEGELLNTRYKHSRKVSESSDVTDYPPSMSPSPIPLLQQIYKSVKRKAFERNLKIFGEMGQSPYRLLKSRSLFVHTNMCSSISDLDLSNLCELYSVGSAWNATSVEVLNRFVRNSF